MFSSDSGGQHAQETRFPLPPLGLLCRLEPDGFTSLRWFPASCSLRSHPPVPPALHPSEQVYLKCFSHGLGLASRHLPPWIPPHPEVKPQPAEAIHRLTPSKASRNGPALASPSSSPQETGQSFLTFPLLKEFSRHPSTCTQRPPPAPLTHLPRVGEPRHKHLS